MVYDRWLHFVIGTRVEIMWEAFISKWFAYCYQTIHSYIIAFEWHMGLKSEDWVILDSWPYVVSILVRKVEYCMLLGGVSFCLSWWREDVDRLPFSSWFQFQNISMTANVLTGKEEVRSLKTAVPLVDFYKTCRRCLEVKFKCEIGR